MHGARQRWVELGTVCIFLNPAAKILRRMWEFLQCTQCNPPLSTKKLYHENFLTYSMWYTVGVEIYAVVLVMLLCYFKENRTMFHA